MSKETIFVFAIGFILFFLGWLNIITGLLIIVTSEDKIFLGLGLESMVLTVFEVTKGDMVFHGFFRIILGIVILVIGNSLVAERHIMFRPSLRDCVDCIDKFRR